jgi:enoyl reductase-like protein
MTRGCLNPTGATLTVTASANATTLQMTGDWSLSFPPETFPFDLLVNGERVTVTNGTTSGPDYVWTVTRAINGIHKIHNIGEAVTMAEPFRLAL